MSFAGLLVGLWLLFTIIEQLFWHSLSFSVIAISSLIITASYLWYGFFKMNNVKKKEYTIPSPSCDIDILQISDLHIGSGLCKRTFAKNIKKIDEEEKDIIVITGDIVDESTKKEDFLQAIELLKSLHATQGKYYVMGNHDWQNDFFKQSMKEAGFTLLDDKQVFFDTFSIIGRKDYFQERKDLNAYRYDRFTILCDHQPVELQSTANHSIPLELCGHTHNGQIWPMGVIARWLHENELMYGHKQIQSSHILVTSGFGGWGYPIRTEGQSEYVLIHVKKNEL